MRARCHAQARRRDRRRLASPRAGPDRARSDGQSGVPADDRAPVPRRGLGRAGRRCACRSSSGSRSAPGTADWEEHRCALPDRHRRPRDEGGVVRMPVSARECRTSRRSGRRDSVTERIPPSARRAVASAARCGADVPCGMPAFGPGCPDPSARGRRRRPRAAPRTRDPARARRARRPASPCPASAAAGILNLPRAGGSRCTRPAPRRRSSPARCAGSRRSGSCRRRRQGCWSDSRWAWRRTRTRRA